MAAFEQIDFSFQRLPLGVSGPSAIGKANGVIGRPLRSRPFPKRLVERE